MFCQSKSTQCKHMFMGFKKNILIMLDMVIHHYNSYFGNCISAILFNYDGNMK